MMRAMDQLEPIEKASVDELRALSSNGLRWTLAHAYDKVPHTAGLDAARVHPGDLKELADLANFRSRPRPSCAKNYPFACSPADCGISCACTPRAALRGSPRWSATQETSLPGRR